VLSFTAFAPNTIALPLTQNTIMQINISIQGTPLSTITSRFSATLAGISGAINGQFFVFYNTTSLPIAVGQQTIVVYDNGVSISTTTTTITVTEAQLNVQSIIQLPLTDVSTTLVVSLADPSSGATISLLTSSSSVIGTYSEGVPGNGVYTMTGLDCTKVSFMTLQVPGKTALQYTTMSVACTILKTTTLSGYSFNQNTIIRKAITAKNGVLLQNI
jgi:hypothetical protein